MSASFLQNELEKINTQISFLNEEITILKEKQALAQQTVSDYEKKNSVAKLLMGKNAVTKGAKNTASFGKNGAIASTIPIKTVSSPQQTADEIPLITPIL